MQVANHAPGLLLVSDPLILLANPASSNPMSLGSQQENAAYDVRIIISMNIIMVTIRRGALAAWQICRVELWHQ